MQQEGKLPIWNFLVSLTVATAAAIGILLFPAQTAAGAGMGVAYCINMLIPALFPFMTLCAYVMRSDLSEKVGKLFSPVTRTLFYLPDGCGAAILMTMIGGYPVGAKCVSALLEKKQITAREADRMMCFCVNSGPAFVVTAVGAGMLGSKRAGWILFASQLLSMLLIGILCGIIARLKKEKFSESPEYVTVKKGDAFTRAANDAMRAMTGMCAFVILFNALIYLLRACNVSKGITGLFSLFGMPLGEAASMMSVIFEITSACGDLTFFKAPLWLFAFALGFSGLCVQFQLFSIVKVKKLKFIGYRVLQGMIAAGFTILLTRLFPQAGETFYNTVSGTTGKLSSGVTAFGAFMILCISSLICLKNRVEIFGGKCYNHNKE